MKKNLFILPVFLLAVLALIMGATAWAQGLEIEEFDDFEVFIEINAFDLDAGFQGMLDGEAWNQVTVRGPNGQPIFRSDPGGNLAKHGVTEASWESNEPPFLPSEEAEDDYTLGDFLDLFEEGTYTAEGMMVEGGKLTGETELTHLLPAGPVVIQPMEDQVVVSGTNLTIQWQEVTTEFDPYDPQGTATPALSADAIVEYIVVVEYDGVVNPDTPDEEEIAGTVTIEDISPDDAVGGIFSVLILAQFLPQLDPGDVVDAEFEFKIEVGAREESGNTTFWEVPLVAVAPAGP